MIRKLIWLAITSGLAKKLYTQFRARQGGAARPRRTPGSFPNDR